ncbi:phosphate propanoyltransferase [Ferviditalea candida]|uniref:Phosphate propanoyltransferase n=1 Tax=Ferviditalea candida TaxID=3108399 RepID=A0ABU5ZJF7_9BACL|nr:phosphate propanoyltransferase [Paenibacillaceae bacterium T2]
MKQVPIGVSARHIHLSAEHLEALFGSSYDLRKLKDLSQPGQFAAVETVRVEGPKGFYDHVRILGPVRSQTQLEISMSDSKALGLECPVRQSGDLEGSPGFKLIGPSGELEVKEGAIVAARHIHFNTKEAEQWGIRNQQLLRVRVNGKRPLIFEEVMAKVSDRYALDMHIDTDEANAAGIEGVCSGEILDW